jgi:serine phosphatase RsbU (regulator of sigma subunit)
MKKRPTANGSDADVEAMTRELAELRAELDQRRRRDEERERFDAISKALVGELDPAEVLDRAERWAIAALGRPCRIVRDRPLDDTALPLGAGAPVMWLAIDGPSLGPDDDAAAQMVAERIGRALDAAQRVATQTQAMRTLERSLLPDALLPVPGLQLAKRHVPAQGSHDLSGDFYDAIRTGDTVTLIVGDVQGKGVEAATLTSLARHTLRAGALGGQSPAEILRHLNTALLYGQEEQLAGGRDQLLRFVTAVAARLEPMDDGSPGFTLTIARAGQPPPIIVRGDGRFEPIEPRGMLLGVSETPAFDEATTTFAVGDTLVLYTDGVIEQRGDDNHAMSEQHLGMLVRNRRGVIDAEAIAQLIEDTVHLVAPEDIRDDVAILVACATTR